MLLVAVEHGAQLLFACVLEVAVELAVLNRIFILGDMERIAGRAVAVRAKKRTSNSTPGRGFFVSLSAL